MAGDSFRLNKESILKEIHFLCENTTNLEVITTKLLAQGIISSNTKEKIFHEVTSYQQNYTFYNELMSKTTDQNYHSLLTILRESHNGHIAEIIEKSRSAVQCSLTKESSMTVQKRKRCSSEDLFPEQPSRKRHKNLKKWWPEEKHLIQSFVERMDDDNQSVLAKLRQNLESQSEKQILISQKTVVSGLGGIGKSTTAKWFAKTYSNDYDHIIWLDSEGTAISNTLSSLANDLNIDQEFTTNKPKPLHVIFKDIFKELESYKILFIYDNADEYTGSSGIQSVLPKSESAHCIITSRNQSWGSSDGFGAIPVFHLDVFSKSEALKFLNQTLSSYVRSSDNRDEILEKLGEELGRLPLALQHAAAAIKRIPKMTVEKYLNKIQKQKEMYTFIQLNHLDDYERSIFTTLSITIEQMKEMAQVGSEAIEILYICAFFRPDYIPTSIFESDEAVSLLQQYSLISSWDDTEVESDDEEDEDDGEIYVNMHRLLQQVIFLTVKKNDEILPVLDKAIEYAQKCKNDQQYHSEAVWDYIEKHADLISKYSTFPSVIMNLQGYLTEKTQIKFIKALLSDGVQICNNQETIDFFANYISGREGIDDDDLDYMNLFKQISKALVSLTECNVTMPAIVKSRYNLAARLNYLKLLIRLKNFDEGCKYFQSICADLHIFENLCTFKSCRDEYYVTLTLDDEMFFLEDWKSMPRMYAKPPDILKIGCELYCLTKIHDSEQNYKLVLEELIKITEQKKKEFISANFKAFLQYHLGDFSTSYCFFKLGLDLFLNSDKAKSDGSYCLSYLSAYMLILSDHSKIFNSEEKFTSFVKPLVTVCKSLKEISNPKLYTLIIFQLRHFGFKVAFLGKQLNYPLIGAKSLLELYLILFEFIGIPNEGKGLSHDTKTLIYSFTIAELSAQMYAVGKEHQKALEVYKQACNCLKLISNQFINEDNKNSSFCKSDLQVRLKTIGKPIVEALQKTGSIVDIDVIETESETVKHHFKFPINGFVNTDFIF